MKKHTTLIFSVMLFFILIAFSAFAETDIDQHPECKHCGMSRKQYGYSRMLVEYKNGVKVGTCSIHCVVTELAASKNSEVLSFKVADRNTRKLIDATKAFWVIGGKKRGVMTVRAKWAFATREGGDTFIKNYGGKIATWEQTLAAAKEDATPKEK